MQLLYTYLSLAHYRIFKKSNFYIFYEINMLLKNIFSFTFRKQHKSFQDKRKKEFQRNVALVHNGVTPYIPDPINGGNNVCIS